MHSPFWSLPKLIVDGPWIVNFLNYSSNLTNKLQLCIRLHRPDFSQSNLFYFLHISAHRDTRQ